MQYDELQILRIPQWLDSWGLRTWKDDEDLPKPPAEYYMASMPLKVLRQLSGVSERTKEQRKRQTRERGYQRRHEIERSEKIGRYIKYGYPLSTQKGLDPKEHSELVNPGWLPTAIVVNILRPGDVRERVGARTTLEPSHAIEVRHDGNSATLRYPSSDKALDAISDPETLEPLEIIDGQHRVFGADSIEDLPDNYCVPVILFEGLTLSWQAYLFWVINVEPKKMNTSLAFDLYPELRDQSWLERSVWIRVYQQHRAQELTEILWRHDESPWADRIELHGRRIEGHVSNAAFIRALTASFVRKWGGGNRPGGLFGSIDRRGTTYILPWKRAQQAALLIDIWKRILKAVEECDAAWALQARESHRQLSLDRRKEVNPNDFDPAFAGAYSLLATDQGVRAVLSIFNALLQIQHEELNLHKWYVDELSDEPTNEDVTSALRSIETLDSYIAYMKRATRLLTNSFDWRTSKEPNVRQDQALYDRQATYRGSSGYKKLTLDALRAVAGAGENDESIKTTAHYAFGKLS